MPTCMDLVLPLGYDKTLDRPIHRLNFTLLNLFLGLIKGTFPNPEISVIQNWLFYTPPLLAGLLNHRVGYRDKSVSVRNLFESAGFKFF